GASGIPEAVQRDAGLRIRRLAGAPQALREWLRNDRRQPCQRCCVEVADQQDRAIRSRVPATTKFLRRMMGMIDPRGRITKRPPFHVRPSSFVWLQWRDESEIFHGRLEYFRRDASFHDVEVL